MSSSRETMELISALPGGAEFAAYLGDDMEFGDGEIVSIRLDRELGSQLVLRLPWKRCRVTFVLDEWVDVQMLGFSRQNVIGALRARPAPERDPGFAEAGVGYIPAEIELVFEPCFGAHGTVRGRVKAIRIEPEPKPAV